MTEQAIAAYCGSCGGRGPCGCPTPKLPLSIDTLARTIIGEARGEGYLDMLGVACVVRERVLRPGWWGRTWEGTCKARWQFTCWQDHNVPVVRSAETLAAAQWPIAVAAAEAAVHHLRDRDVMQLFAVDRLDDLPTHYYSLPLTAPPSAWGDEVQILDVPWQSAFTWCVVRQGRPWRVGEVIR